MIHVYFKQPQKRHRTSEQALIKTAKAKHRAGWQEGRKSRLHLISAWGWRAVIVDPRRRRQGTRESVQSSPPRTLANTGTTLLLRTGNSFEWGRMYLLRQMKEPTAAIHDPTHTGAAWWGSLWFSSQRDASSNIYPLPACLPACLDSTRHACWEFG
jgi:hypothetical protein